MMMEAGSHGCKRYDEADNGNARIRSRGTHAILRLAQDRWEAVSSAVSNFQLPHTLLPVVCPSLTRYLEIASQHTKCPISCSSTP